MAFFVFFCLAICLFFCFLSFLDFDGFKSTFYFSLGVIFCGVSMSLGLSVLYSYFFVLIFLSGVMSMLIYFSSLNFCFYKLLSYWYLVFLFFFFLDFSVGLDFFVFDLVLFDVYMFNNFFYYFWVIFVLFFFLFLLSLGLNFRGCLRYV